MSDRDDLVYIKQGKKYTSIGRLWDRDYLGFGNWYVYVKKYSRGVRSIDAVPADPDLKKLIAAVDLCEDEIVACIGKMREQKTPASNWDVFNNIRACLVQAFEAHKKELVERLK